VEHALELANLRADPVGPASLHVVPAQATVREQPEAGTWR